MENNGSNGREFLERVVIAFSWQHGDCVVRVYFTDAKCGGKALLGMFTVPATISLEQLMQTILGMRDGLATAGMVKVEEASRGVRGD